MTDTTDPIEGTDLTDPEPIADIEGELIDLTDDPIGPGFEPPAGFRRWGARAKSAWVWNELLVGTEYGPVERPDLKLPGPLTMLSIAGRRQVLARTLDHAGDTMEPARPKIIHPVGAVALVELETFAESRYTGVLAAPPRGGAAGLVRISLAAPATGNKSITPGMGLKLFVDGQASLDLLAMNHTVGQGRDFDLFSNVFNHDLTREHTELRPPQKLMKLLFNRVTSEPRRLEIDHFAAVESDGTAVAAPVVPDRLVFVPHPDVAGAYTDCHPDDFRDPLLRLASGTGLWWVDAVAHDGSTKRIGVIRTTRRFVCSRGGDRLFFRHHVAPGHRRAGPTDAPPVAGMGPDPLTGPASGSAATAAAGPASTGRTKPSLGDHLKARAIRLMRRSHLRTLETTSARTYRRRAMPTAPAPRLVPAARLYRRMGWLPTGLLAPERMPPEAKLPLKYYLPYYATSKIAWTLYRRNPIDPNLEWSPDLSWNRFFAGAAEGWGEPSSDEGFVTLRLQGPNPFMLRRVDPEPELGEGGEQVYSLDFGPLYRGVFAPTEARFVLRAGALVPSSIRIDDRVVMAGDPGWQDAKRVVNGLDGRYSVFIRHLLNVHLMVGQAYALAAYSLPTWHPLRPFMHLFTYGTLVVNDAAYKSLLRPISYFLQANYVSAADARQLIENAMSEFDFDEWIWPRDREARGLGDIADHPYVRHGEPLWNAFVEMIEGHLDRIGIVADADVVGDRHIGRWFETLGDVLPGHERLESLETRADLVEIMGALLWNNVIHEVCGNLSPILDSRDPADLVTINLEHLRALIDPDRPTPAPRAADVFLIDQATYTSRFNVAGNNLMTLPVARYVDDPRLIQAVLALRERLGEIEADQAGKTQMVPFANMAPSKFEASISF